MSELNYKMPSFENSLKTYLINELEDKKNKILVNNTKRYKYLFHLEE